MHPQKLCVRSTLEAIPNILSSFHTEEIKLASKSRSTPLLISSTIPHWMSKKRAEGDKQLTKAHTMSPLNCRYTQKLIKEKRGQTHIDEDTYFWFANHDVK